MSIVRIRAGGHHSSGMSHDHFFGERRAGQANESSPKPRSHYISQNLRHSFTTLGFDALSGTDKDHFLLETRIHITQQLAGSVRRRRENYQFNIVQSLVKSAG